MNTTSQQLSAARLQGKSLAYQVGLFLTNKKLAFHLKIYNK
jgi:hypothetical protein